MAELLNLKQIEAFRAIMISGTVVAAAKLLNLSQPAVSRTLGLLELRVGYSLFERMGRRLIPTPEAEALYREIEQLYGSLDRISQISQDIKFQRAGALRIATLPALAHALVPRAVTRFASTRPGVKVFIQSLPSRQIADMVSTGQFDVAVVELPLSKSGISLEPLPISPMVALMPASHPLAGKKRVSLKHLENERMILLSQQSFARYQIEDAFSKMNISPLVVMETPSSQIACALVAEGSGITIVSKWSAEPFLAPGLAAVPISEDLTSRYAVIFPYPRKRLMLAESFADELRKVIIDDFQDNGS